MVLSANPSSGIDSLTTKLSATVGGAATGTINYSFWWNCNNAATTVGATETACGKLTPAGLGKCVETPNVGYKCNGIAATTQTADHTYASPADYWPKVVVERGGTSNENHILVKVTPNTLPFVTNVTVAGVDYCSSNAVSVGWKFNDADTGDSQSAFQVQVATDSLFKSIVYDSGKVSGGGSAHTVNGLTWGSSYYAHVKVWDMHSGESPYVSSVKFTLPAAQYPKPAFDWLPKKPKVDEEVTFTDRTDYSKVSPLLRLWSFGDCQGKKKCLFSSSTAASPVNIFYKDKSVHSTALEVSFVGGYVCKSDSQDVTIGDATDPSWREVAPQ